MVTRRAHRPKQLVPLSARAARTGDMLILAFAYLFVAVPTAYLAIGAYTPCVSNFEGGCGMARGLAAIISLFPAAAACVLGIFLMQKLGAHPAITRKIPAVSLAGSLLYALF